MRPMTRALVAALASSALILGTAPLAFAARGYAIDWKPCAEAPAVDCGFLTLPIDYSKPDGEKFQLAVSRRKANDPSRRIGALVVNPGGPGTSGVDFSFEADQYFSKEIVDRFDVIGFDPRGVARSQPIKCSAEAVVGSHTDTPANVAEYDEMIAYNRTLNDDCRKHSGPIFDHASSREAADDIDSNMDPSLGAWRLLETEARGAEEVFDEWVKWNDRTPSSPLHGKDLAGPARQGGQG